MKVLIIGSGGREHAIAWKLSSENNVKKIYCAPGNAGIADVAQCLNIDDSDIDSLVKFAKENNIDLTIVGPEVPLVNGVVDEFEKENLRIFGPNQKCSQLEGSKAFCKDFMVRHEIPTAKYKEYTDLEKAINEIDRFGYPVVIKVDGLASGKGVVISQNREDAISTLREIMEDKRFGTAGDKIVVEEFLKGIETSILAFVDNDTIVPMVSAKDHKKVFNNEKGANTGGMGTFSPSEIYTNELAEEIRVNVLQKTLEGFKKDNEGAKVLEYNVRFGDPETQSVLFRLESNLSQIMDSIIDNNLKNIDIKYSEEEAVCVMLTSGGYPEVYEKGKIITGLDKLDKDIVVFHSGTKLVDNNLVTNGGRVIGITAKDKTVKNAAQKVYENIKRVNFEGMHYRTDIGI